MSVTKIDNRTTESVLRNVLVLLLARFFWELTNVYHRAIYFFQVLRFPGRRLRRPTNESNIFCFKIDNSIMKIINTYSLTSYVSQSLCHPQRSLHPSTARYFVDVAYRFCYGNPTIL